MLPLAGDAAAQSGTQVKPYILLILDISGSMDSATGSGPPSCGGADTRLNHAKCAIQKLVNTYGDVEFGFARFRPGSVNTTCAGGCNGNVSCGSTGGEADLFELLVPITDTSADSISPWVDLTCGTCSYDPSDDPDMQAGGLTPLGGSLRGAKRYFEGADPFYATDLAPIYGTGPDDPIRNDPFKDEFVGGEQCRPYVTVLLTDGDETCQTFDDGDRTNDNDTLDAATNLLVTNVDGVDYRITTRPIGFGITPPTPDTQNQIEAIAHAGGEPDLSGFNEGLYAADEVGLSLAFAQIIEDSVKVEICDGIDNDCDGNVDEGFQLYCDKDGLMGPPTDIPSYCVDPLDDCDNSDDNCFQGTADEPVNACGVCGDAPVESCNTFDDDCDGKVDEGLDGVPGSLCDGCVFQGQESCDNVDNDCDGTVDEGLTRPCGTDVGECVAGTETCVAGVFTDCTATTGTDEICDGLDNDCDGTVDGFVEQCSTAGNDPPYNAPCQPGFRVCPPDGSGVFGDCLGEIAPSPEACDNEDNDCDLTVDEDTGGGDCSSTCGTGTLECQSGDLVCVGSSTPSDEVCNNLDDDCDGTIDEDVPNGGPCDEGGTLCLPGELVCIGGGFQCVGGTPPAPDVCDCDDNDCDGSVDEDPNGTLCPTGSQCVDCSCQYPCGNSETPCNPGEICVNDFCVPDPCFGVTCSPTGGSATTCVEGECVPICDTKTCPTGLVCRPSDGACVKDDCSSFPDKCAANEVCEAGQCVSNPCAGVDCPDPGDYCFDGDCVGTCAGVECPQGQDCHLGQCVDDQCSGVTCPSTQVCNPADGQCVPEQCEGVHCDVGQVCDPVTGECGTDPCLGVECPAKQVCTGGSCYDSGDVSPDGGLIDHDYVSAGGGGGCSVGSSGGLGALFIALAVFAALRRREDEEVGQ